MDNVDRVKRKGQAEQILKSELWEEAWRVFRLRVFGAIENAKTDEGTIRGKLMLGIATDVRRVLENIIKDGEVAAAEIKLEEERKRRGA